jgi:hypothetical protein
MRARSEFLGRNLSKWQTSYTFGVFKRITKSGRIQKIPVNLGDFTNIEQGVMADCREAFTVIRLG